MLTDKDLQELLAYRSESKVLSVYLDTDPTEGNVDFHKLYLRSMLKDIDLPDDVEAVTRYIEHEHDWSGRSVAIFSCVADDYFRAFTLAVSIRSRVRVSDRPYVKPLADILDSYGGYGVVLIDKQDARMFYFHLGELREEEEIEGESVRRVKHGGGSQSFGARGGAGGTFYEDEGERNIKEAAELATKFFKANNVRRVLIGGTEDNVAAFRNELPKSWQSLIVGTFPISMHATHNEILEKAMRIGEEVDERKEEQLAELIVTNAAKGKGGVLGLDDTLKAVHEGRVQVLLIRDHFQAPGCRCKSCGYLSAYEMASCPFCGGECEKIPDAVEMAVRKVMQMGGEVEVLHRDHPVGQFDKIGALLRY
jgi:peptide subunit release factor 1 (eRF1)